MKRLLICTDLILKIRIRIFDGVGGGEYAPDRSVTRAEFTAMLVRALGRGISSSTAPYDDVMAGTWYFKEVAKAKELGLLDFVSGKSFMPYQPLTREEMASMLAAVIALEKLPITKELVSLDGYKDIGNVTAGYLEDVRMMVKLKIMTGTGADTFSPKGETTRAQAATVFIRTLQALSTSQFDFYKSFYSWYYVWFSRSKSLKEPVYDEKKINRINRSRIARDQQIVVPIIDKNKCHLRSF